MDLISDQAAELALQEPTKKTTRCWYNYVFTKFQYDDAYIQGLKDVDTRYICFGEELTKEGKPHLQGFVCFKTRIAWSSAKTLLNNPSYLDHMRGRIEDNDLYCKKDDKYYEQGVPPKTNQQIGKEERERWARVLKLCKDGSFDTLELENPKWYLHNKKLAYDHYEDALAKIYMPSPLKHERLRYWQKYAYDILSEPVDSRQIYIWYDNKGGHGKTSFINHVASKMEGVFISDSPDIAANAYLLSRTYPRPKIVLFDFARQDKEIPWGLIEKIKNGRLQSTKYQPLSLKFKQPHVHVFCNETGYIELSEDRICKIDIEKFERQMKKKNEIE